MRIYNISTTIKEHSAAKEKIVKETVILSDNEDLSEFVQMMYGGWYDVVKFDVEEANIIHISKNYIKQEALKVIRIRFD
tara:strand:- start:298 stop:534 length:237 start_codon:yes stop_codon:yes gene_type:complete